MSDLDGGQRVPTASLQMTQWGQVSDTTEGHTALNLDRLEQRADRKPHEVQKNVKGSPSLGEG